MQSLSLSLSLNSSMKFGAMADTDYSITIKSESKNSQSAVLASGNMMKSSGGDVIVPDGGGRKVTRVWALMVALMIRLIQ